jgi:hypothetical protein
MGYWNRLFQELKDTYTENKKILDEIYKRDILTYTGIILIFVSAFLLFIQITVYFLLINFNIISFYPPDPTINSNLMMKIFLLIFIPFTIGFLLITLKNRPSTRRITNKKSTESKKSVESKSNLEIKIGKSLKEKYDESEDFNLTKFTLTRSDFDIIVKKLEEKKVKSVCPMCGFETLSLSKFFGFSQHYIRTSDFIELDDGIPTIVIACQRCGFLMEHALTPLELTDIKKISEINLQGDKKDV